MTTRRPNVVLILADDLGFSDLGCYGGEIVTPHLDALGRSGVRLSQFYNTARCSPSRASLLTGLHPHQTGIGVLTRPDLPDGYAGTLDPTVRTVAETLAANGWTTWLSGKWHLAADTGSPNDSWPTRKGFQRFYGTLAGCSSYFDPQTLTRGEEPADDAKADPGYYYTDAIGAEAAEWIGTHAADQPFFLYLAFTAPHWPLHALAPDVEANAGRFDDGWDTLRDRRTAHLAEEGILAPDTRLGERDPGQPQWTDAGDRDWQLRRMETYAAQVTAMDRAVGTVLDAIRATGHLDDTLVIFLSDNGASAEELPIGERFTAKDRVLVDGTRSGEPVRAGNQRAIAPGGEDTYASYGTAWANLSNAPLRRYKRWVHEGGISTPFIVHWPGGGVRPGVAHTPAQLVDVVPTILDAAGLDPAAPQEGRSILPALRGDAMPAVPLFWEHIGNAAVRSGRWKLVRAYPGEWELYDIDADRTELYDLSAEHPPVVESLAAAWEAWAQRVGVLDWTDMVDRYTNNGLSPADAEE